MVEEVLTPLRRAYLQKCLNYRSSGGEQNPLEVTVYARAFLP